MDAIELRLAGIWYIYTGEDASLHSQRRIKDFGLDSLDCVELAIEIENEFSIDIKDGDEDGFDAMTFTDLVRFVRKASNPRGKNEQI